MTLHERLCRAAALTAALLLTTGSAALATEPQAPPSEERALFSVLARRALEFDEPGVSQALLTLRAKGFLGQLMEAVDEVRADQGRDPEVERRVEALHDVAERWLRAYPYNGYHVFSGFRVMSLDWTPGKSTARMEIRVETKDRTTNTYSQQTVLLVVPIASMQVSEYRILS